VGSARTVPPVELHIGAPPERVWEVFAEPGTYTFWVVGARSIERKDPRWPEPGSSFDHTQGKWPLIIKDETEVAESDPPRRIVLLAKARPLLVAKVIAELRPEGTGTRVMMEEQPVGGLLGPLMKIPPNPTLTRLRNKESLRRVSELARGEQPWPKEPATKPPAHSGG
jgi:uncharacterized protein YndB with AHSA1/START domain